MLPTVSIVLAVHNGATYLRAALDSILSQTYSDFEFLIVDDASVDDTASIIASYDDSRIRLIRNPVNLGLTRSLNLALRSARGEFVARMDHDDVAEPDRIATQVQFLADHAKVGLLGTAVTAIDDAGRELDLIKKPETHDQITRHLASANCLVHPTVMFRRTLLESVGFYNENLRFSQDYDLWLRYSEQTEVHNLQAPLLKYRVHAGQISVGKVLQQSQCAHVAVRAARQRRQGLSGQGNCLSQPLANLWFEWRGRPGSLASFYLGQIDNFRTMPNRAVPRGLAWRAALNAPLSPSAWRHLRNQYLQAAPRLSRSEGVR